MGTPAVAGPELVAAELSDPADLAFGTGAFPPRVDAPEPGRNGRNGDGRADDAGLDDFFTAPLGVGRRRRDVTPAKAVGGPRRWTTGLAAACWIAGALLVAVVALVVARWPEAGVTGASPSVDLAVVRALQADRVLSVAMWIEYVATLLVLGGAVFRLFVSRPPLTGRGTPERVLLLAAVAGAATCLATLPLRAVVVGHGGLRAAVDPDALSLVATSQFGDAACVRLVALVLFALALARPPRGWERRLRIIRPDTTVLLFGSISSRTIERALCVASGAVALVSFSLAGHPQASEPQGLLLAAQAAHVLAASVWFGGGAVLALEIRRQHRWGSPRCTAETVARFSTLAGAAVVLVAATGIVLARSQVASVAALWSTAYGRALLAKLGLVGVVVALGAYNHQYLVPAVVRADDDGGWRTLGRTAAAEGVVMAVGILVATAAMTSGGW